MGGADDRAAVDQDVGRFAVQHDEMRRVLSLPLSARTFAAATIRASRPNPWPSHIAFGATLRLSIHDSDIHAGEGQEARRPPYVYAEIGHLRSTPAGLAPASCCLIDGPLVSLLSFGRIRLSKQCSLNSNSPFCGGHMLPM